MEYFIVANSFAAPIISDTTMKHVEGDTPDNALLNFVESYKHPCGLYAASCFESADAYYKKRDSLATWLSNHAKKMLEEIDKKHSSIIKTLQPGQFTIDGKAFKIEDPKEGQIVKQQED